MFDLEETYKNNISYLKKNWAGFAKSVEGADISSYGVDANPFGINISRNGEYIYPTFVDSAIESQVDTFLSKPPSIFKKPTIFFKKKGTEKHATLLNNIEAISSYGYKNWEHYSTNIELDSLPFVLVFGIGNAKHIEYLINKKDIKNLIIVDKDYSLLKVSMHTVDWVKIIQHFNRPGYSIDFYVGKEADALGYTILNEIFAHRPYRGYYIPYFFHQKNEFFEKVIEHILEKIQLVFQGLGFIDDELNSMQKTLENLKYNVPIFMNTKKVPKDSTLFIIASGPSIDKDIEYIKKNKDNVVIFSSGTALRILEKNDIVPDFHFEIEREVEIHEIMVKHISKEFLKKVSFIGLNVVYDKVFKNFKESYMYFRSNDSGSSLVPEHIARFDHCNPTVTNGVISFASKLGFKNIYLFGADMGFKDIENHHSKDSFFYSKDNKDFKWKQEVTNILEGNLSEDKILTTSVFYWAKQRIENVIVDQKLRVFNCSDGAKIKYTLPFKSNDIKVEYMNKNESVDAIKDNFKSLDTHSKVFQLNYEKQLKIFEDAVSKLKLIYNRKIEKFSDIFHILDTSYSVFSDLVDTKGPRLNGEKTVLAFTLLRGTIASVYATIYTHCLATHDRDKAIEFASKSFELIIESIEDLKQEIIDIVDEKLN